MSNITSLNSENPVSDTDRPLACDIPQRKLLYLYNKEQGRGLPLSELPVSVEDILMSSALWLGLGKWANTERGDVVEFEEWQTAHIARGNLPIPYPIMEEARAEERLGVSSPAFGAECKRRLNPLSYDYSAWGYMHYYTRWPKQGSLSRFWVERYERLAAEGYGDLWYVPDYDALPELDPATILAEREVLQKAAQPA